MMERAESEWEGVGEGHNSQTAPRNAPLPNVCLHSQKNRSKFSPFRFIFLSFAVRYWQMNCLACNKPLNQNVPTVGWQRVKKKRQIKTQNQTANGVLIKQWRNRAEKGLSVGVFLYLDFNTDLRPRQAAYRNVLNKQHRRWRTFWCIVSVGGRCFYLLCVGRQERKK